MGQVGHQSPAPRAASRRSPRARACAFPPPTQARSLTTPERARLAATSPRASSPLPRPRPACVFPPLCLKCPKPWPPRRSAMAGRPFPCASEVRAVALETLHHGREGIDEAHRELRAPEGVVRLAQVVHVVRVVAGPQVGGVVGLEVHLLPDALVNHGEEASENVHALVHALHAALVVAGLLQLLQGVRCGGEELVAGRGLRGPRVPSSRRRHHQ
mmetsp:Transcript_22032/g.74094  ORF Transcript_22032/g.74094 Transcript_22032/m.74094 type:complete len:215 (-) Transcript_22032:44-688(-)